MGELAEDGAASLASLGLVAVKDGEQALPDLAGLLGGVNGLPDARLLVVVDHRGGLLVVGLEALLESVGIVVGALDQWLARDVVGHLLLGRVELDVVAAARGGVDQTAGDARYEELVVNLELDGVLEGLVALAEHLVETLGLGDGAGETVKDEAAVCHMSGSVSGTTLPRLRHKNIPALALLVVVELLLDHANDNLVRDETAGIHDLLSRLAEGGLLGNLGPEHVTGGLSSDDAVVSEPDSGW